MCVLIHTAKKNLLRRDELLEAMRKNSSGFFIAELLPGGKRNTLRTLSSSDAQTFWDNIPDSSEVVMHFRVPSRGAASLANVHGWESDKIIFGHNRTIYNLFSSMEDDKWDGTDSEYFFRQIFIPLYRRLGRKAYRNGRFTPLLDHIVRSICGDFNKFLFVMPDNCVLRYGDWEGDDATRPGFHASNKSYEIPSDEHRNTWLDRIKRMFERS